MIFFLFSYLLLLFRFIIVVVAFLFYFFLDSFLRSYLLLNLSKIPRDYRKDFIFEMPNRCGINKICVCFRCVDTVAFVRRTFRMYFIADIHSYITQQTEQEDLLLLLFHEMQSIEPLPNITFPNILCEAKVQIFTLVQLNFGLYYNFQARHENLNMKCRTNDILTCATLWESDLLSFT